MVLRREIGKHHSSPTSFELQKPTRGVSFSGYWGLNLPDEKGENASPCLFFYSSCIMLERCKNSSCTEVERGEKKRQLIVEYVKQPRGSPQGNRRAGRAAGHCTRVGSACPAIRMGGCGGGTIWTRIVPGVTSLAHVHKWSYRRVIGRFNQLYWKLDCRGLSSQWLWGFLLTRYSPIYVLKCDSCTY